MKTESCGKALKHPERSICGISPLIRGVLSDGPATSVEVGAELGISAEKACLGFWVLSYQGQIREVGRVPHKDRPSKGPRSLKLWDLTPRGRAYLRRDKRHPAPGQES